VGCAVGRSWISDTHEGRISEERVREGSSNKGKASGDTANEGSSKIGRIWEDGSREGTSRTGKIADGKTRDCRAKSGGAKEGKARWGKTKGATWDGASKEDTAKKGSDRVGAARESASPVGRASEAGTSGTDMGFNSASGLDKTGPRNGSNELRGSAGVVIVGVTTFTAELVTGFPTPVDKSAPTDTSGDRRSTIGVSIELGEMIGDSTGTSGDNGFTNGDSIGVSIELSGIGLMIGEIAGKSGITIGDKIEFTALVGRIGASVGARLGTDDKERVGSTSVGTVLSSSVASAGSVAVTVDVSAGIGLWTAGDKMGMRVETTGETRDAAGEITGRSGITTDESSGSGLWTTGDRAGRRGVTTGDISGAKGDSEATVPGIIGTLILVAKEEIAGDIIANVAGTRRALSTIGTMFTTGATAGVAKLNTGERVSTTGLVTTLKTTPRGRRGFTVVDTAIGVDVVGRIELDTGATGTDGMTFAKTCERGVGELVGRTVATVATFVDDDIVAGCNEVSPSKLEVCCADSIVAIGCVKLPPNPSTLDATCIDKAVAGGCIKPPPKPSILNPPGVVDKTIDDEAGGCTKSPNPRTLTAACVDDVTSGCIKAPPNPSTLKPPC
jgi:hypothetical protein